MKRQWRALLAQTKTDGNNYSLTRGYLGDVAGTPGTPIPSGPDPKIKPVDTAAPAQDSSPSLVPKSVGLQLGVNLDNGDKGISAQGAVGVMVTPQGNGAFATGGVYDYWSKTSNFVKGLFGGGGLSLVLSNAQNINQIKGDGFTLSGNVALGAKGFGFSLTPGSNGIYTLSIAILPMPGIGLGASRSLVDTRTLVTEFK